MGVAQRSVRIVAAAALALAFGGCCSPVPTRDGPSRLSDVRPVPYEGVASSYNERLEGLDRFSARARVVIDGEDAGGKRLREHAEGNALYRRPRDLALLLGRLGDTKLYLGSNDRFYWWFDMIDGDEKRAWIGEHDLVTPRKIDALGLPVSPLGLIELLGISPLPRTGGAAALGRRADGAGVFVVEPDGPGRGRLLRLDAASDLPLYIAVRDESGRVLLDARLEEYEAVRIREGAEARPVLAGLVTAYPRGFRGEIRIRLRDPRSRSLNEAAFDPAGLLERYRIDVVTDLDDREPIVGMRTRQRGPGGASGVVETSGGR